MWLTPKSEMHRRCQTKEGLYTSQSQAYWTANDLEDEATFTLTMKIE